MALKRLLTTAAVLATTTLASAGPEWVEQGDAGSGTNDAQTTTGVGTVSRIRGTLSALDGVPFGPGDFQDVYIIQIDTPSFFEAFTDNGSTGFMSRLYLFTIDGEGLLGNETGGGGGLLSLLPNASTDGTGILILQPGLYLLAITVSPFGPICPEGSIFAFTSPDEVSGPDGPAGGDCAFVDWTIKPVLFGACCFDDGTPCEPVTEDECLKLGGSYLGNATDCAECPPVGACCSGDSCQILTEDACDGLEGSYLGDGTTCEPNPCIPMGACCLLDGMCLELDEASCDAMSGLYQGDGTTCVGVGGCTGACEVPTANTAGGFSCFVTSELNCQSALGTYLGNGSVCEGACCLYDGTCILADGPFDCASSEGTFLGHNTTCEPNPCTGACFTKGSGCLDGLTEQACDLEDGFFFGFGTTCDDLSTEGDGESGPEGTGGIAGTSGNYVIKLTGTMFAGVPAGIPTMSEWGLMILGLVLLVAITVLIRRT